MKTIYPISRAFCLFALLLLLHARSSDDSESLAELKVSLATPADDATDVAIKPTLSWSGSSSVSGDALTYDVYLDINNPPTTTVSMGKNETSYAVNTALETTTTYYWKVIAKDSNGAEASSLVRSFTTDEGTENSSPTAPVLTAPANNATDIEVTPTLSWEASIDPEGDDITYDVYLDTNNPPTTAIHTGQAETSYTVSTALNTVTTYYWRILAKDSGGAETNSLVRSFTTLNAPPTAPVLTAPADNATNIAVLPILTWEASTDPEGDAIAYDIYLDTNNPPTTAIHTGQGETSYTVNTALDYTQIYYWKVVARDGQNNNQNESLVWQFTTTCLPLTYNGTTYASVQIGNQCWMAENLNDDSHTIGESSCYDNDASNCDTYGRLYDWEAAKDMADKIPGWHLPSDEEWKDLEKTLGISESVIDDKGNRGTDQGTQLKEGGSSGFNGLLGGYHVPPDWFYLGSSGYFWSSSPSGSGYAWYRRVYSGDGKLYRSSNRVNYRFSVRLLKD